MEHFFGQRLKREIASAGLTQAEFARKIYKDPAWLSHVINSDRQPSFNMLQTIILHLPKTVDVRKLVMGP